MTVNRSKYSFRFFIFYFCFSSFIWMPQEQQQPPSPDVSHSFCKFDPNATRNLVTRLGLKSQPSAQQGLNRELSDSACNVLTHTAAILSILILIQSKWRWPKSDRSKCNHANSVYLVRPSEIHYEITGPKLRGLSFVVFKSPMRPNFAFWYILSWVKKINRQIICWYLKRKLEFVKALLIVITENMVVWDKNYIRLTTSLSKVYVNKSDTYYVSEYYFWSIYQISSILATEVSNYYSWVLQNCIKNFSFRIISRANFRSKF